MRENNLIRLFNLFISLSAVSILFGCKESVKNEPDYPIHPVAFTNVKITDDFWSKRLETNHRVTIPIAFRKAEETGRIDNFRIAGGLKEGKFASIYPFDDSDVFKNIEAACYSLQIYPDPILEAYLDTLISTIAAAQEDDGYLYTNRTIDPVNPHEWSGKNRWEFEEENSHELYNAGHLYEAAVAHYQATGKRTLLGVAIKNANLIENQFGWGKIEKAPGHQEIEIGLVKLYRVTGDRRYLDLARFFLDVRGPGKDPYNQMHLKVLDQKEAAGHAVRAQYMYAAMADVAALTGTMDYVKAIDTLWSDVVSGKTYITGGIGAAGEIEGFGKPYELPNEEAYCETCASVANALWNYRMFLLHGESKYFDVFEKVLYNGLLSGVSVSGDHFFYPNPLASDGHYARKEWFGCACCPVNMTRFLPSLPGYIYALDDNRLFINLFIANKAVLKFKGQDVRIEQVTQYPWDGRVNINLGLEKPSSFNLMIRIPGWAVNQAFPTDLYYFENKQEIQPELFINGAKEEFQMVNGYASIDRKWKNDDLIVLNMPMEILVVKADEKVQADQGKVALQRGPVIFCLEAVDNNNVDLESILIENKAGLSFEYREDLLNGVGTIKGNLLAIPYYSWANRDSGKMKVWIQEKQ